MKDIIILQTCVPDYRKKLFVYIQESLENRFGLYGGDDYFEASVKTDRSIIFLKRIKNHYFFGRRFLVQWGMWLDILKAKTVVLELNPRIISNWIILFLRIFLGKKTVLWGHAWPKNGKNSPTDKIRGAMRQLASVILVYTVTQKNELQLKMPKKKILCAPNSLFYKNEMLSNNDASVIQNIIYVGRLTALKKPFLLLMAFKKALYQLPNEVKLIIVGEGEEKEKLINYVKINDLEKRVLIMGHISDYNKLKSFYYTSLVSVSPGYIGLSVTQSFSFGVPMIVSKDENHSPEIEAVIEEFNAKYFDTDNIDSLSNRILELYENKSYWLKKREDISNFCKDNYSIEVMSEAFFDLIN